jgi:hypothetical protein
MGSIFKCKTCNWECDVELVEILDYTKKEDFQQMTSDQFTNWINTLYSGNRAAAFMALGISRPYCYKLCSGDVKNAITYRICL